MTMMGCEGMEGHSGGAGGEYHQARYDAEA